MAKDQTLTALSKNNLGDAFEDKLNGSPRVEIVTREMREDQSMYLNYFIPKNTQYQPVGSKSKSPLRIAPDASTERDLQKDTPAFVDKDRIVTAPTTNRKELANEIISV